MCARGRILQGLVALAVGCSGGPPATQPPGGERAAARVDARAPVAGLEGATELRFDATGLWSGAARVDVGEVDGRLPALVERLRAVRARAHADEAPGPDMGPPPARIASFTILDVRLAADPSTSFRALAAIASSVAQVPGAATLSVHATGEPEDSAVLLSFPEPGAAGPSDALLVIGETSVYATPPGGSVVAEPRRPDESVAATVARALATAPALTSGPVAVAANPDVTLATFLEATRALRAGGATTLHLSVGAR